jgi:phage terminase large subunit
MPQFQLNESDIDFLLDTYLANPQDFVKEVLGCNTWSVQDDIVKSVFKYKTTAVKTCNAIGKSYIAARIVVTYLMLHPGSIVVTTAPTWAQVTDVLWREIATAVEKSLYKLTDKDVNQAGLSLDTDWYAIGRSTNKPENFFGYHADHILVVVDEAGGVDEPIFKGVAAITPNINARILYIGNPTNPSGTFYKSFTDPALGANCFTVSAFQTPNFTANNIQTVDDLQRIFTPQAGISQVDWTNAINAKLNIPYPNLIDPSRVYERFHEWGVDSPAWQALIMGEFPTEADQQLIPTNLVTMAMNMYGKDDATDEKYSDISGWNIPDGLPEYGQDMARFGSDSNVNYGRRGGWVDEASTWNKVDLMESANRILNIIDPLDRNVRVNIDDTGNGGGTTDRMRQLSEESFRGGLPVHQYQLVAYNFSSKEMMSDHQREKYHDVTSMLYWNLRTWFIKKQIALHYDKNLFNELVGRRWSITTAGKIKIESKDEYKKRTGGKSPDRSDALALAFAGGSRDIETNMPEREEYLSKELRPITAGLQEHY